jgi:DNA-binding transcriptional MerR regulator
VSEGDETALTIEQLIERVGDITPRGIRYYIQRGLLPRPVFRGPGTVYPLEYVARIQAIRRLQGEHRSLEFIKKRLARLDADAIRRIAEGAPVAVSKPGPVEPTSPAARRPGGGLWVRWELVPGLELSMSEGADAATRALAEALRDEAARLRGKG